MQSAANGTTNVVYESDADGARLVRIPTRREGGCHRHRCAT